MDACQIGLTGDPTGIELSLFFFRIVETWASTFMFSADVRKRPPQDRLFPAACGSQAFSGNAQKQQL
jgi:hypothetical protein